MSINVTVSGNPVNIKKGRMVTADPNYAKKEFEKRRLLRLEQVRQQSKDIAEDVRNKVRRERKKQESEIEEEGRQKLKNWQNRKLLELQTQYKEALRELGAGHKEAEALEDESEVVAERKEQNEKRASDRGRLAASKLQVEKNKANFKKSIPIQHKKLVRDIENARAALVSNIKKKKATIGKCSTKKRKKASADISITIPAESHSESEESRELSAEEEIYEEQLLHMAKEQQASSCSCETTEDSENAQISMDSNENDIATNLPNQESTDPLELPGPKPSLNMERSTSEGPYAQRIRESTSEVPYAGRVRESAGEVPYTQRIRESASEMPYAGRTHESATEVPYAERIRERSRNVIPLDTRISDRIRRREIMASQLDYCDIVAETNPSPFIKSNTQISDAIESRYTNRDSSGPNVCKCEKNRIKCLCGQRLNGNGSANMCTCGKSQVKCYCKQGLKENGPGNLCTCGKKQAKCFCRREPKESGPGNTCICQQKNRSKCSLLCGQGPKESSTKIGNGQSASLPDRKSKDSNAHEEIPTKPPIKLKDPSDPGGKDAEPSRITLESTDSHKVQYYDHANRFSQDKLSHSHVEKITTDSIEVLPNVTSEAEWYEKMRQRDREAQMRGQRALEKERIQKDYEDMVKKLPLLQKKERICEINKDKPEFHMTEERLKERERKKQNSLDNAYTKLFPNLKPAMVTLPRKKHEAETRIAPDDDEPTQSLNVGKWDVDHEEPKMFTIEEVQEIIRAFTGQKPKDRQAKLKELLSGLRLQKEQLLDEIRCLPKDESIDALIHDLHSVSDTCRPRKRDRICNRKRSHEENEKESSLDSTTESTSTSDSKPQRRRRSKVTPRRCQGEYGKTPSPRKKAKMKLKRSVLILQNTSTQTTPKTVDLGKSPHQDKPKDTEEPQKRSKGQGSVKICNKLHAPCDCNKENENSAEELCQIVIKINDNEEPEVVVKAKEKEHQVSDEISKTRQRSPSPKIEKRIESKSIAIGTDEITRISLKEVVEEKRKPSKTRQASPPAATEQPKKETRRETERVKSRRDQPPPPPEERSDFKAKSWREQLSKNSLSSASTSYLSPPNFQAPKDQTLSSHAESSRQSFYDLHKKPQQGNLYDVSGLSISQSQSPVGERTIDPILLAHIKKLLSMSRDSVDNLTVSTSNVQTPSQSVVEIDSNNPLAQLHNLIRYFNLRAEDIARELSYSPDVSPMHYNSTSSASEKSLQQRQPEQINRGPHVTVQSPKSGSSEKQSSTHTLKSTSTQSIMAQYTDVTDSCSKRIANLASMIQQIREEKIEMLQNPPGVVVQENKSGDPSQTPSEQDVSTGYLDLPGSREGSKHSSVNSSEDEDIHKRLLEIDLILANKLRKFTTLREEPIVEEAESRRDLAGPSKEARDETTDELWMRLKRLTEAADSQPHAATTSDISKDNNQPFVSFLSDIPKLPKLEAQPEPSSSHRRPPPSKGLTIAKKFNGNILLVPHELSTIAEADSQVSTRLSSSVVSPNTSKTSQSLSPRKDLKLVRHQHQGIETLSSSKSSKSSSSKSPLTSIKLSDDPSEKQTGTDRSKSGKSGTPPSHYSLSMDVSSKSKTSGEVPPNKSVTAVSKKSVLVSSSSSDDLESIEAMLKSIGMEWAIPTLHKTHEAMALASSSSSQDVSAKQKSTSNSTGSEVSLKEFISKQMINKVSSSSLNSDASPASFSLEFSDLSAIQLHSSNNKSRRTSTPISSSASKSKGSLRQVIFSNGSDISSVNAYDNQSFHSLSEQSHSKNGM